ncbi:MAG: hypothetical protein RIA65_17855 [Woeseia sp.]
MYRQASRGLPKRVTLAVFILLLVAVIAAQARPTNGQRAGFAANTEAVRDGGGLLTTRLARLAFAKDASAAGPAPKARLMKRR